MTPGIQSHVPAELRDLYEIYDYHHAAAILNTEFHADYMQLCGALLKFRFTLKDITDKGGNESNIPKTFAKLLRPDWKVAKLKASMLVDDQAIQSDTHSIDFVKGRVAFDLEWNSKDQTFDRDLFAFRTFFDHGRISAAVLVTRSISLNTIFKKHGILPKYGASTTHIGKLIPRIDAGRGGGCPILVFGITEKLLKGS